MYRMSQKKLGSSIGYRGEILYKILQTMLCLKIERSIFQLFIVVAFSFFLASYFVYYFFECKLKKDVPDLNFF